MKVFLFFKAFYTYEGHGERAGEGEMYGKSNMETYITICKIDSHWEFAVWLRKLKQGLWINLEGWDGEGDGRELQKGGDICIPIADSHWIFPVAQMVKNLPAKQKTQIRSLGWKDALEKGMAIHSSILAWRISWPEEPGRPQSMGSHSRTRLSDQHYHYTYETYRVSNSNILPEKNRTLLRDVICCCSSIIKSWPTLCNPMNCSTPGFPVLLYFPELAQIHVHWVGDAT